MSAQLKEQSMRAYHGDSAIKEKYLTRVRLHRAADNLIQGTGWDEGKGCAVETKVQDFSATLAKYPTTVSQYLKPLIPGMRNRGMRPDEISRHLEKLANNQI